jgi:hypothetical protein
MTDVKGDDAGLHTKRELPVFRPRHDQQRKEHRREQGEEGDAP